jgi:hypothetical protein|tara:strand:+ start:863 stop:991 length:129 start_codon:yes stop_codon:yes gene_type:complete
MFNNGAGNNFWILVVNLATGKTDVTLKMVAWRDYKINSGTTE